MEHTAEQQRLARIGVLQQQEQPLPPVATARPSLAQMIGGALRGDAKSLHAVENTVADAALLAEALVLLRARLQHPAEGQFAATVILRHARTGEVGDLGTLCQECLQIVQAAPRAAGNRQLLAAAASAATRAGPESALAVLAEAMRLATIPAAESGETASLMALQLLRSLGEEAARPAVGRAVREGLRGQSADLLGVLRGALMMEGPSEGGVAEEALATLKQWSEDGRLGVSMDTVLATEGLLWALCQMLASSDEYIVDSLADCLDALLPRAFSTGVHPSEELWRGKGQALNELGGAVVAQSSRLGDGQPMLVRRGICRIVVAVTAVQPALAPTTALKRLLTPGQCTEAVPAQLLQGLVAAVGLRDRATASIALEGLVPMLETRRLAPQQVEALLNAVLGHARYIDDESEGARASFEDEDEADVYFDAEEWSRVREQSIADSILACFEGQRLAVLRHICAGFEAALSSTDWRAAEACLFAVGIFAPALLRFQLVRNPERLLSSPSAQVEGLTAESLSVEQAATRATLTTLFQLILSDASASVAPTLSTPPLRAGVVRLGAGYARWLATEAEDSLLAAMFIHTLRTIKSMADAAHAPGGGGDMVRYAREQQVKFGTTALCNLCNRGTERLAAALASNEQLAHALVDTCTSLPAAVAAGGIWSTDAADAAVLGSCRLLAGCPAVLTSLAAPRLTQCWAEALGASLQAASSSTDCVDLASAEDGVAVLSQFAAGVRGLCSKPEGGSAARTMLLQMAPMVQASAAQWADDDVAGAVAELLHRSLELISGVADELFDWLHLVIASLHAHHPAAGCGVVEQLLVRWGSLANDAGGPSRASAAIHGLMGVVEASLGASEMAGEGLAAALSCAEQYTAFCGDIIGADSGAATVHYSQCMASAVAAAAAAEPATLSAALRYIGGLQANCNPDTGGLSPSTPVGAALLLHAGGFSRALGWQLCGRCDESQCHTVAKTLYWLTATQSLPAELRALAAAGVTESLSASQAAAAAQPPPAGAALSQETFTEWTQQLWKLCR